MAFKRSLSNLQTLRGLQFGLNAVEKFWFFLPHLPIHSFDNNCCLALASRANKALQTALEF